MVDAMSDPIESPEDFAETMASSTDTSGTGFCQVTMSTPETVALIRARDAAIGAFAIERRDRDWLLAMADALGTGSGYKVPIVPATAPFRELFAAVRRAALREAADWLASKVADVRVVTLDCRREAIALKAAGKDWKDAFDRECLSSSRCSGFTDAEEHFRALASKEPDDAKL